MKRLSLALLLTIALSPSLLCAEPLPSSRYEVLNEKIFGHLELLSDKAHADRMLGGGVSLVLGGLFVGGGALILSDNPASLPEVEMIGYTCVGAGALLGLLSLPTLLIPSAEEKAFAKYQDYPSRSEREVKSKYEKGERDFRDLADSRKQGRIMSGGTSIALAGC